MSHWACQSVRGSSGERAGLGTNLLMRIQETLQLSQCAVEGDGEWKRRQGGEGPCYCVRRRVNKAKKRDWPSGRGHLLQYIES